MNAITVLTQPLDLSTEAGRGRERLRRAVLTTLVSVAAKAVALAANLISIPLTLNYLGSERFGLWASISAANALLDFADLGVSNGLMNIVASASATGDRQRLQTAVSSAFFMLLAIGALAPTLFFTAAPLIDWARLFPHAKPGLLSEAVQASGVFACCFALNLPLGVARRVQLGFQQGFLSNLWLGFGSILSLASLLVAIHFKAGLAVLVLCMAGAPVVMLAFNNLHEFGIVRPWLRPSLGSFDWNTGRRLAKSGLMFVCLQLSSIIFFSADPLIAGSCLGLAAAAQFTVAQRLYSFLYAMQSMWITPLWPAYGEAWTTGDLGWIRRTLRRSTLMAIGITAAGGAILTLFRAQIYPLWLHRDFVPSLALTLPLCLTLIVLSAAQSCSMFLNGINAVRQQAVVSLAAAGLVTLLKIEFATRFGEAGIPWGFLLGYLPIVVPFFIWLTRKLLRERDSREERLLAAVYA